MQFFAGLLLVVFIITAVLLTLLVFIQDDQGEGMGGIFAGGSATPFGSRGGNVLQRMTSTLAVVFFVAALGFGYLNRGQAGSGILEELAAPQSENAGNWWEENNTAPAETLTPAEGDVGVVSETGE
jgi:preprotein translocase subunit SecG